MVELGESYKGQYTLVMSNNERLFLESWIVNDYYAGHKVDDKCAELIKKAIRIYPDNA